MGVLKHGLVIALTGLTCASARAGDEKIAAGDPSTVSRTVSYHETDIIPIATEVRFTTLIELPKEESILEVTCGDKEFWPVNWTGNLAYIKPAKVGSRTNLNLITASGNVYSFLATEVSNIAGSHADLKVFVNPVDSTAVMAMKDKPQFIPAASVEIYKKQAEKAQAQLLSQQAAVKKELARERVEMRAQATAAIRHDYQYSSAAQKSPFHVTGIYHDDRFTYIEAQPSEAPAVYEIKDGKPSLIQFEFDPRAGRYTIDKILDDGYLRVGKSQLRFHRENG
jgi:type IV secretion system protein VirB9